MKTQFKTITERLYAAFKITNDLTKGFTGQKEESVYVFKFNGNVIKLYHEENRCELTTPTGQKLTGSFSYNAKELFLLVTPKGAADWELITFLHSELTRKA